VLSSTPFGWGRDIVFFKFGLKGADEFRDPLAFLFLVGQSDGGLPFLRPVREIEAAADRDEFFTKCLTDCLLAGDFDEVVFAEFHFFCFHCLEFNHCNHFSGREVDNWI